MITRILSISYFLLSVNITYTIGNPFAKFTSLLIFELGALHASHPFPLLIVKQIQVRLVYTGVNESELNQILETKACFLGKKTAESGLDLNNS